MGYEYVRFSGTEKYFGQKNFLQSQLEVLNLIKSLSSYRKLRDEELLLKISLKNKIESCMEEINKLDKLLPKSSYLPHEIKRKVIKEEEIKEEDRTIEQEIVAVREKLRKLQMNL